MKLLAALTVLASSAIAGSVSTLNPATTCQKQGQIALTFDDGPSPNTHEILNVLRREGVKATFHVSVGLLSNLAQQEHVRKARDDGHLLGLRFDAKMTLQQLEAMSVQQLREKLDGESKAIHAVTGVFPRFIRLPFGFRALDGTLARRITELGYIPTLWTIDSHDYKQITPNEMYKETYENPFVRDGGLNKGIVLHRDLFDITAVLERGIQHLKALDMQFVNLGECVGQDFVYKTDLEGRGEFLTIAGETDAEFQGGSDGFATGETTSTGTTTVTTGSNGSTSGTIPGTTTSSTGTTVTTVGGENTSDTEDNVNEPVDPVEEEEEEEEEEEFEEEEVDGNEDEGSREVGILPETQQESNTASTTIQASLVALVMAAVVAI